MTQLESTISNLTPATIARLTGTAVVAADDSTAVTVKATLAQIRTMMFAGGTGYTATDPLLVGGEIGSNAAALATSATTPFLWVPSTAGTPTGIPAASAGGAVPLVVDTTNNKLYARVAGAWSGVPISSVTSTVTLVTTLTASASATLAYTSFASGSYPSYLLILSDIFAVNTPVNFQVEGSVDGGANYGALWTYSLTAGNAATITGTASTAATMARLGTQVVNTASVGTSGQLLLTFGQAASQRSRLTGTMGQQYASAVNTTFAGFYNSASAVNALRFSFDSGNIASGNIKIYGIS